MTTEQVTMTGYTKGEDPYDIDVNLNVYTVELTDNPQYFKIDATATLWINKIVVEY